MPYQMVHMELVWRFDGSLTSEDGNDGPLEAIVKILIKPINQPIQGSYKNFSSVQGLDSKHKHFYGQSSQSIHKLWNIR